MRSLRIFAVFLLAACTAELEPEALVLQELRIALVDGGGAGDLVPLLEEDLRLRDADGRLVLDGAEPDLQISVTLAESPAGEGAFRIHGEDGEYIVEASEPLGAQYGVYELLERAGIVFFGSSRYRVGEI